MTSEEAKQIIKQSQGKHLEKIYIPSLGDYKFFYPLTTANVKTLTRINFIDKFDLSIELLKLHLFDSLCTEDLSKQGINSHTITELDYLSFLIGLRQLLKNDITFTFKCKQCGEKFKVDIKLDEQFDDIISQFKPQHQFFEKTDESMDKVWKFELENYSMENYLYYKYVIEQLNETSKTNPDVANQNRYLRPILYIKNIYLNDELIEDWPTLAFPQKLSFFNKISPNVTINETPSNKSLYGFIFNTFAEEKLEQQIKNMTVECTNCRKKYKGVFELSNFFTFQGLRTTI